MTTTSTISTFTCAIFSPVPSEDGGDRAQSRFDPIDCDYITSDQNRVVFGRYGRCARDNDDCVSVEASKDKHQHSQPRQFPTGERRVREFDPRSWRFGQTYVVPEQTSARYLCLGDTRQSLLCRLLVNYHAKGIEHRLALGDVLRAIDSPAFQKKPISFANSKSTLLETTVELPFKLLSMVRAAEMCKPEFTAAVIDTLLNSVRAIRCEYVRYNELVYSRLLAGEVIDENLNWRNLTGDRDRFCEQLLKFERTDCARPRIILACSIQPLADWSSAATDAECHIQKESTITDCKLLFSTPPFVDDQLLHLWLSMEIRHFHDRILPVLLCAIPHFSIYDRTCATRCPVISDVGDSGDEECAECACVPLYRYRAVLTKSVVTIITHRLIFDIRYNASRLLPFVSADRMRELFLRLTHNGFVCAAVPISYFVASDVVVARAKKLIDRLAQATLNNVNDSSQMCLYGMTVLALNKQALYHMIRSRLFPTQGASSPFDWSSTLPYTMTSIRARTSVRNQRMTDESVNFVAQNRDPNSLQMNALRILVLSRGISYFLTFVHEMTLPGQLFDSVEAYFQKTCWFFVEQFEKYIDREVVAKSLWWQTHVWKLGKCESPHVSIDRDIAVDQIYDLTNYGESRRLLKRKREHIANGGRECDIDWSYNGCCKKGKLTVSVTTTANLDEDYDDVTSGGICAKEFAVAPYNYISFYNAALKYAHFGRLSLDDVQTLLFLDDDRINFALLGTLDRNDDTIWTSDATIYYHPLLRVTQNYRDICVHSCKIVAGNREAFDRNVLLCGGRAISDYDTGVLHPAMRRLPEFLHENIAWLWLRVSAETFREWFALSRSTRRLSALETDRSRTAAVAVSSIEAVVPTKRQLLRQRITLARFATSFWHAAHDTVAFVNLVYARLERYPEEAGTLFGDISKWSWWYWYPLPVYNPRRIRCNESDMNRGGPRTDVWILALAALFVPRRDFLRSLDHFCHTAICEFVMIEEREDREQEWMLMLQRKTTTVEDANPEDDDSAAASEKNNPLEGYSAGVMARLRRIFAEGDRWFTEISRRLNKRKPPTLDEKEGDDDEVCHHYYCYNYYDGDYYDSDYYEENDWFYIFNENNFDNDEATVTSDDLFNRICAIFARVSTNGKDSAVLRALDCLLVMTNLYRVNSSLSRKSDNFSCSLVADLFNTTRRYCCDAFRADWNEQLREFADECERSVAELSESTSVNFAVRVREEGITAAIANAASVDPDAHRRAISSCGRYFARILWWFVATAMNFERDLCVRCYQK